MWWNLIRAAIAAVIIVVVADVSRRSPRLGAVLLTLPITSILAFVMSWSEHGDMAALSKMARETLVLVPLGLPFFVPLAFAETLGLDFWPALTLGIVLATVAIGAWLWLGPQW